MFFPRFASVLLACLAVTPILRGEITVKELPDRVRIEIDGQLFTEYRHTGAPHVYYYPLIGPGGAKMTRAWPMDEAPGEEHDHPHHRSLWFAHGEVNGMDFWLENKPGTPSKRPAGEIVHDGIVEAKSGPTVGVLTTKQKWVGPDGTIPITGVQTLRVHATPATERLFDFEVTLTAGDKDVVFGDTKEGTMAIRIAESMRMKTADKKPGSGHIVTNTGKRDGAAWGQRSAWVDYTGKVDGKVLGIAFLDHPGNLRHPTRWHARDYGLFAANPFCEHEMDKTQAKGAGDHTLPAGKSLTLRYRILLHEGETDSARIDKVFSEYSAAK